MLRIRAVRALLVEEVAGLPRAGARAAGTEPGGDGEPETEELREQERDLSRAQRRALIVTILCAVTVAVLFAVRDPARRWLAPGRHDEGVFALAVLLVTAYAGFRLAQYLHLRTVARLHRELAERED